MRELPPARYSWPRVTTLILVALALAYPGCLLWASQAGSAIGVNIDVGARRDLARELSYASDPASGPTYAADIGQPVTAVLDPTAVGQQLTDNALYIETVPGATHQVAVATAPSGSASPAPLAAPPLTAPSGSATPAPVAPPPPSPSAPPGNPMGGRKPSPSPGQSSCGEPTGRGKYHGQVQDTNGTAVGGATMALFWNGCQIATATSDPNGQVTVLGLAVSTTYTYTVSATGYQSSTGSFTTNSGGNASSTITLTP